MSDPDPDGDRSRLLRGPSAAVVETVCARPRPGAGGPACPATGRDPGAFTLRDYAFLADGERGALLDPTGNIAWLCAPSWDSPPVFAALLGGPGVYEIRPVARSVWGGHDEPGGLIWRSRWVTDLDAVVDSRDCLAFPGEPGLLVLLRCIRAGRGRSRVEATLDLRGTGATQLREHPDHTWTVSLGGLHLRWSGPARVGVRETDAGRLLHADLEVGEDAGCDLVLEISDRPLSGTVDVGALWAATEQARAGRVPRLPAALDERDACHKAAVLVGDDVPGHRGDGGRGDHRDPGADQAGPRLRQPLLLAPRPGVLGDRGVHRRDRRPRRRCGRVRVRAAARRRPRGHARLHHPRWTDPPAHRRARRPARCAAWSAPWPRAEPMRCPARSSTRPSARDDGF